MAPSEPAISVVPANEASWEDLQTIFGTRGTASRCQCQRYKLRPREAFGNFPAEERAFRLREQTECGHRESDTTSGLVAFARERGARAIEGYPITTKNVIAEDLHVGTEATFAEAGFSVVSRPTLRRVVMRLDF